MYRYYKTVHEMSGYAAHIKMGGTAEVFIRLLSQVEKPGEKPFYFQKNRRRKT
jgi:hypothetical protein